MLLWTPSGKIFKDYKNFFSDTSANVIRRKLTWTFVRCLINIEEKNWRVLWLSATHNRVKWGLTEFSLECVRSHKIWFKSFKQQQQLKNNTENWCWIYEHVIVDDWEKQLCFSMSPANCWRTLARRHRRSVPVDDTKSELILAWSTFHNNRSTLSRR